MKIALATKHRVFFLFMIIISLSFVAAPAIAETRYVSDLLIISVREGQADDSPIIGYIRSDTPVDVIEEDGALVYINTPDNLEGWVKKKFLVSEKPKSILIDELKLRIIDLEDKIILLQQKPESGGQPDMATEFKSKIDALQKDIKNEKRMTAKLENELRQANGKYNDLLEQQNQNPDVNEKLQVLKEKNQELITKLQHVKQKPKPSFFSGNIKWFLTGVGVLILGFIIGRSLRRKPRYRY